MKLKLFLISVAFIAFMSCKDTNPSNDPEDGMIEQTEGGIDAHGHETHEHDEHNHETETELTLNNGVKWKSDEPTNNHAQKMIEIAEEFGLKSTNANLEMFRNYADILQQELNGMIKDCKMDGPDHDALHLWLEPVLHGVKELKDADNEDEARNMASDLSEKIIKYDQFFN